MIKQQPCSTCTAMRDMTLIRQMESVSFKGKTINFEAEFYRCPVCGDEIEEPGQLDRNLDAAREVYDRLYATPPREELVALREKYGASQKAFGQLLGFGEATINNYEQGDAPNPSNRLLLRLAANPAIFKTMYDMNKDKIGLLQRRRVEESPGYREACDWVMAPCSTFRAAFTLVPPKWVPSESGIATADYVVAEASSKYGVAG